MSMKNPLTPAGIEPATFRFVAQHFGVGNLRGRDHLVDLAVKGAITLKWVLE